MALVVLTAGIGFAAAAMGSGGDPRETAAIGPPNGGGAGWQPRIHSAKRYAMRRAGEVSFAVIDLDGRMRSFHAPGHCTHRQRDQGDVPGGLPAPGLGPSSRVCAPPIAACSDPMIRRSDNVAATRVRDIVGRDAIERVARDAGMRDFSYDQVWGLSRTSARDQVRFMYHLGRYIPKRHRRYARHLLSSIVPSQRWGIAQVEAKGLEALLQGRLGDRHRRASTTRSPSSRSTAGASSVAILTEFDPSHSYGKRTLKGVAAPPPARPPEAAQAVLRPRAQVHWGPNSGGRETIGFRTSASRARSAIPRAVRPKCSMQASPVPEMPNSSPIPTAKIGTGCCSAASCADRVGEAADHAMLLRGDRDAGLRKRLEDGLRLKGLDDRDVEDLGLDPVLMLERLGRLHRPPDHVAGGDQRDVLALAQHVDAAAEALGDVLVDDRRRRAAKAHVHRLVALVRLERRPVGLVVIGGDDHRHPWHRPHQGEVLDHLMRGAVLAERNAAV